jgi:hypothetical protein
MPKRKAGSFNPYQIKDGWIVKMYKDGRSRSKIEPYAPKSKKKVTNNG